MKIVYLAAGAAGMYCGSCLHDNTLAAALMAAGEDVLLVPTYTPIRTDEVDVSLPRVMYGGINVYLQQKSALFQHTPWFLDRLLDSPRLLNWLSGRAASVSPEKLGGLAVSMLEGESGRQRKELKKLVRWLADDVRPDLLHLSNSMLVGMAGEVSRQLRVPVLCSLSGEDIFLERLPAPYYERARRLLRERSRDIAAFVSLNGYYADFMSQYLDVERSRIHVIPHGLKLGGHGTRRRAADATGVTIGYLARICPEKGLHHLVEAFRLLASDKDLPPIRLLAAGYLGAADRPYLERITRQVAEWGLADRFQYMGELDRAAKIAFFQSLDMLSVPTVYRESKGISILEALANAVPVVLPAHGCFPELVEDTGGGLLVPPDDPPALAAALRRLVVAPAQAAELGLRGQQAVHARYTDREMAVRTLDLYRRVVESHGGQQTQAAREIAGA